MRRVILEGRPGEVHLIDSYDVWQGVRREVTLCAKTGLAWIDPNELLAPSQRSPVCPDCKRMVGILSRP